MKKIYLLTLILLIINICQLHAAGPGSSNHKVQSGVGCAYSDNFNGINDTTSLHTRGYKTYYRGGGPQGTTPTWFQGNPLTTFIAYNGSDSGYVASNFNSVTGANNIDNWLVLPSLPLQMNDLVSFYSKSPSGSPFPDSLHVWYSAAGDSTPEDTTWVLLGEFQVNVIDIWEYKAFAIPQGSSNGRIAIRYAVIDGGPGGTNSNYIGIDELNVFTPSVVDGNLFEIISPTDGCQLSNAETVTITIKNTGANSISGFDVSYTVDAGPVVTENIPGTVTAGGFLNYSFTTKADLSLEGNHTIIAKTVVPSDTNLCNDEGSITVRNYYPVNPLTNPYSMGFEIGEDFTGWEYEDVNIDGVHWDPVDVYSHSGTSSMRKAASANTDDDWLFSDCLEMVSGTNYTLDYWYMIFDVPTGCNIESYIGSSQNHTTMNQPIAHDPLPADTLYHHSITTFTVPVSGVYNIGWHAYSNSGTSSIRVDDIHLDDGTFIGIRENAAAKMVSLYPNPATGIFYLNTPNSYKNITVEVFDISGQIVYSSKINNLNRQRIDLSSQSNGIYTVRIKSDSFVENHSVVVNK